MYHRPVSSDSAAGPALNGGQTKAGLHRAVRERLVQTVTFNILRNFLIAFLVP